MTTKKHLTTVSYDKVGKTYDTTRCADPEIVQGLLAFMNPSKEKKYVDISCGSGNYTTALFDAGLDITGVDISATMLNQAQLKNSTIMWHQADVHQLPFDNNTFDGVFCIHAMHHYQDLNKASKEMHRILKSQGKVILFGTLLDQCKHQWILYYFPFIWETAQSILKSQEETIKILKDAGFSDIRFEKYFIGKQSRDLSLYAGKYHPEIYLDPIIRSGMTPFNMPKYAKEIERGCTKLAEDISSGEIQNIMNQYESGHGEYIYNYF